MSQKTSTLSAIHITNSDYEIVQSVELSPNEVATTNIKDATGTNTMYCVMDGNVADPNDFHLRVELHNENGDIQHKVNIPYSFTLSFAEDGWNIHLRSTVPSPDTSDDLDEDEKFSNIASYLFAGQEELNELNDSAEARGESFRSFFKEWTDLPPNILGLVAFHATHYMHMERSSRTHFEAENNGPKGLH